MTEKSAKEIVKAAYPRAKCFWFDWKQRFAVKSYRCGEQITVESFTTKRDAWIAAAHAVEGGTTDLPQ